ncbi:Protein of unknown function [Methanobrevibacter olleyae]|uniref:Uncharacterized protein n=1 Tax=Methanobrevibacter olleyae TaxID=294671 RepID=A0A1I4ICK1_METOL|nr:DUF4012 domain-containing protein [Methanobrevibacter olleyae]SFL51787.1 Protein of unknown function [Methanobrevibacter olleyae]
MIRKQKLIIAILSVILIWLLVVIGSFFAGPDLTAENKTVLVLAADKYEQPNGGCDMAYIVRLEDGHLKGYDPFYPGGMTHPSQPAPGNLKGNMRMHDCLWNGVEDGMKYAKEIVEYHNGTHIDAVVVIYDEGLDNVIDSVRPLEVDGQVTNLSATDIIRENDNYAGYKGRENIHTGTMSRSDAVMVLVKALSKAAKDPSKKETMVKAALEEYKKGNIIMTPEGSFARLLATKGFESIV